MVIHLMNVMTHKHSKGVTGAPDRKGTARAFGATAHLFQLVTRFIPSRAIASLYSMPVMARTVRKLLNRNLPCGFHDVEICAGLLRGSRMRLDLMAEKFYWLGTYECPLVNRLSRIIEDGWVVYDVGANIGYMSLVMAKLTGEGGTVVSFEPLAANAERLRYNAALNGLGRRIAVHQVAVDEKPGMVEFMLNRCHAMGHVASVKEEYSSFRSCCIVEATSIDAVLASSPRAHWPRLIKIDVEGGEARVLRGGLRTLECCRPVLVIELHSRLLAREALMLLDSSGYVVRRLSEPDIALNRDSLLADKEYVFAMPESARRS